MNNNFGDRIRELRIKSGKSQTQVASELNISQTWVSSAETRIAQPQRKTIMRWASYYGVDPSFLSDREFAEKPVREQKIYKGIGSAIRLIRTEKGIYLTDFARALNISVSAASHLESRDNPTNLSRIQQYADVLGVEPQELIELGEQMWEIDQG